jgi:pyruvate ferredoxin oxidoreductase gamma subunit
VAAFTRISREAIRERGVVAHPELVVVAEATLIADPAARVTQGVSERTAVFVNSPLVPRQLQDSVSLPGRLSTMDLTGRTLAEFGKREAISALLGAVAGRLTGLEPAAVSEAIRRELLDLGLPSAAIGRHQALALRCYEDLAPVELPQPETSPLSSAMLQLPVYEPPGRGTARISAAANSVLRETGGWRTFRPVLDPGKCNGCWLCFAFCPDGVIAMTPEDKPVIDYEHCKGCQICVHECPTKALIAQREEEGAVAWRAK